VSISDQLLAAFLMYGLPVLFGVIVISAIGFPLPDGLMLMAAGSFIKQGDMKLWPALAVSTLAAVAGDGSGYFLARGVGPRLVIKLTHRFGGRTKVEKAEQYVGRRGGTAVFLSRWLITALGPWVNFTCGLAGYPWKRFLILALVGDAVWVGYNVLLGYTFSEEIQQIGETIGSATWIIIGVLLAALLLWWLVRGSQAETKP
jgi:membrane-associated protein